MMYPPSLPTAVKDRAFVAANGELGVLPADAEAFLTACRQDGVAVLGWELWLADHACGSGVTPVAAKGEWSGGLPTAGEGVPVIISGVGDVNQSGAQLASFDIDVEVSPEWAPYVRVNFTLED